MTGTRKAVLWMCGILVWVFALSLGLAWCQFGYFDPHTAASMGLVLIPLLAVAVGTLLRLDLKERSDGDAELEPDPSSSKHPRRADLSGLARSSDGASRIAVTRRASNPVGGGTGRRSFYIVTGAAAALIVLGAAASVALAIYVFVVGRVGP